MKKVSQVLSVILSALLALTSTPWTAFAAGPVALSEPAFVNAFTPAEKLGYVASSYSPTADVSHPRLILVADLHGHVEVQHHIVSILESVVAKINKIAHPANGKKIPVFVEGGWTANLEQPLRTIKNPNTRTFLDEYLLDKSEMGAAQAFSEKSSARNQVTLIGVENQEDYQANRAQFVKTYPARKKILEALVRKDQELKQLSQFVSNSSYLSMQRARDEYNSGRMSSEQYAKNLLHRATRRHVNNSYVETLRNASSASSSDLEVALAQVYHDVAALVAAKPAMSSLLRPSVSGDEKTLRMQLARADANMDLLKRLVGNQLTPAEVPLAMARMPEMIELAKALLGNDANDLNIAQVVNESVNFYPFAMVRDESLAENSIKNLNTFGPDATGVLVVGGFHADAIADYLRAHHISYMEIHPAISRDITSQEQLNYVKRICDDHVTPKELKSDVQWLQTTGRTAATDSALAAPVTDLAPTPVVPPNGPNEGGTPGENKMMGGLSAAAEAILKADQGVVLAAVAAQAAEAGVTQPVTAQVSAEVSARVADELKGIKDKNKSDFNPDLSGKRSVVLTRGADGQWADANGQVNRIWSKLADEMVKRQGDVAKNIKMVTIQEISDEDAIRYGSDGAVITERGKSVDETSTVNIILASTRFRAIDSLAATPNVVAGSAHEAAIFRAFSTFAHEFAGHVLNVNGKDENSAIKVGIAQAFVAAYNLLGRLPGSGSAEQFATRFLNAIASQTEGVAALAEFNAKIPQLAKFLANLVSPQGLDPAAVQKIVAQMETQFPQLTKEQIMKQADDLNKQREYRMMSPGGFTSNLRDRLGRATRTLAAWRAA